jgi:hypothetical protein
MKTGMLNGLSFGFASVNSGQRNISVEPQLVVSPTPGGFRLTGPATAALSISHGDYVQFIHNINSIDNVIREAISGIKNDFTDGILEFCENAGLDVNSPEAYVAIHKQFDAWFIAKGIKEYDTKGNVSKATERLTERDRTEYVNKNFDAMLEAALASEDEELVASLKREGITEEEQKSILTPFVKGALIDKYKGSRAANLSKIVSPGVPVQFTDSYVWNTLKADLKDAATTINRTYSLNLDAIYPLQVSNGFETVTVKALALTEYTDTEAVRRTATGDDDDE